MDYEKIAKVATTLDNAVRDNVALKSLILEASSDIIGNESKGTSKSVMEFLKAPLDDKKEIAMKKAFAAAMVIAKDKGVLYTVPDTAAEIAAVVDDSITRVKAGYHVGVDILEPERAINIIVDHAESRAIAVVEQAFDSGLVREVAATGVVKLAYCIPKLGPIIGPVAEKCKPVIKNVIAKVEEPVKKVIKAGVRAVANVARSVAKTVVEHAKETVKSVAKGILSIFS